MIKLERDDAKMIKWMQNVKAEISVELRKSATEYHEGMFNVYRIAN